MFPGGGVEGHRHHRTADAHHIRTGLWFATGVTDMSCSMNTLLLQVTNIFNYPESR